MATEKNKIVDAYGTPLQTCYVDFIGTMSNSDPDTVMFPKDVESNPCALMEFEWITLWGGFEEAAKLLEDFDEYDDEYPDIAKLIRESDLSAAQKNWAKAIYLKWFRDRKCPFGEDLTIEQFVKRSV